MGAGVGKASLNLIKITELSDLRAVRQQGLDGGVGAWGGGVGKALNLIKITELSGRRFWMVGRCGRGVGGWERLH